jgi:hypothetical protein
VRLQLHSRTDNSSRCAGCCVCLAMAVQSAVHRLCWAGGPAAAVGAFTVENLMNYLHHLSPAATYCTAHSFWLLLFIHPLPLLHRAGCACWPLAELGLSNLPRLVQ